MSKKQSLGKSKKVIATNTQYKADGWTNILTGLGIRGRDKTVSACFRACPQFSIPEIEELYRADGLTRRIIDVVAAEMTRQGWEVEGDTDNDVNARLEELNAYSKIVTLIQWARLYGGAIILMGIADGRQFDQPVNIDNIYSVNWLQVFDKTQCIIIQDHICKDLNDPNYGSPDYYQINDFRTGATFIVHHSRVLRMDWSLLPSRLRWANQGWGDSILVSIHDELRNYGSAFANTAAMMQDFVNGVLKIPELSQSLAGGCSDNDIMKRLDFANLSKGITSMMVLDGAESYEKLSTNVSGVSDLIDRFMLSLSSVTGIPVTLLFGRAPAGLNATGDADIRNFYDMVKQLQEVKLKPILETLVKYIMRSKQGPFDGIELDNWSIQFTPLWQNTEEQEAALRRTVAETDAIYLDRNVVDPNEIAISRFGGGRWSMNTQIDIEARENGYDPQEISTLEREKKEMLEKQGPDATIGPDYFGDPTPNSVIIVDGKDE